MEKKLRIGIDLDDKAFNSAIKRIQDQLNQINAQPQLLAQQRIISQKMQQMGLGALPGAPSDRQMEQAQQRAKQQTDRIFEEQRRKMDIIKRLQKDLNEEIEKGTAEEQRRLEIKERLAQLTLAEKRTTGQMTGLMGPGGVQSRPQPGVSAGERGANVNDFGNIKGLLAGITGAIAAAFAATKLVETVENIRRSFTESGYRAKELQSGSLALPGAPGAQLGALYGGRSMEEFLFKGEREQAHEAARKQMEGRLRGTAAILRPRQTLLGAFGTQDQKELIQQELEREFYELQGQQYEALKRGPQGLQKMAAFQQFKERSQDYNATQRMLGLDYSQFHGPGGFRERAVNAGFTDDMAQQMSNQIIGAGGSTRMGREYTFALKAARGLDVTNAGQILGTLSQNLGGAEVSKQAFVKMIAEGNRLGLDTSEYREENRKFLEATSQVLVRSETGNQDDINRILKQFGGFVAEPTTRGISAAQTAYQAFTQATSATSGPQGVMRGAGFLQDEVIGGMSAADRASLATVPTNQLTTDHPVVKSLARKYGVSPQDIVTRSMKAGMGAIHRFAQGDTLSKDIIEKRQKMMGPLSPQYSKQLQDQIGEKEEDLATILNLEYPGMSPKELTAFAKGTTGVSATDRAKTFEDITKKMEGPTGRPEDAIISGLAQDGKALLESFQQLRGVIVPVAEDLGKFNTQIKENLNAAGQNRTPGPMPSAPPTQSQGGR
jgi:hypothetical protein